MKKFILVLLLLMMLLLLSACGTGNIEKFCDGQSLHWDGFGYRHVDDVMYYALFEDGTLTIEERTPKEYSFTGKIWTTDETFEFSYELKGNDTVIIEGETYTYEISDGRVEFDRELMGFDKYWAR